MAEGVSGEIKSNAIHECCTRVLRELERVAFADARHVAQRDRKPDIDAAGNVTGFEDVMVPTPSRLVTADHAAQVRSVTTKSGFLIFPEQVI